MRAVFRWLVNVMCSAVIVCARMFASVFGRTGCAVAVFYPIDGGCQSLLLQQLLFAVA